MNDVIPSKEGIQLYMFQSWIPAPRFLEDKFRRDDILNVAL